MKIFRGLYICHKCRGTLESTDINMDGNLNLLDLAAIFNKECTGENTI